MVNIHSKTLEDLEFNSVLNQISQFCLTEMGKSLIDEMVPFSTFEEIKHELNLSNEYLSSFQNENVIPFHSFSSIQKEVKILGIEEAYIETPGFKKIENISALSNDIIKFFKKFQEYFPTLNLVSNKIELTTVIIEAIQKAIDKYGEIKNDASPNLKSIRRQLNSVTGELNKSFTSALSYYNSLNVLDDIRESVIDNKRVLAVKAMDRKKVKGKVLGTSKTGSIFFIEPENTHRLTRLFDELKAEEKNEIIKILKELTNYIKPFKLLLIKYEDFLTKIDAIHSKAKYAESINAILPTINVHKEYNIKKAFHPLLLVSNNKQHKKTYPQSITLNSENRIIVISGPNAGGKSITLKTIGLLQVMLQTGILVPVHESSTVCLFDRIISDIGDNQSIENHLSTYSYRLKQMNYFLKKCNDNTLFLIDEFGTGSDPELGGALAETFLEEFYDREAYGVITTHYSNLKLLANELPFMMNANMLFNEKNLEPEFKLILGEAGSSFTFEVAQKNGIPFSLINKAKKKIEKGKIRFDKTIAKLQKERFKLEKTTLSLKENEAKKLAEADKLENINEKIQKKLEDYQQLYDSNQKTVSLGKKFNEIADSYFYSKDKKVLFSNLYKMVQVENSKKIKLTKKEKVVQKKVEKKVENEVEKKIIVIREKKQEQKAEIRKQEAKQKQQVSFKVGDKVRLLDGKSCGIIDKIEKNKAIVNYGIFTTEASLGQLELVIRAKQK